MNQGINITVFSTTHCPSCQTLKQWLDKQDIVYESVNLEEEPQRQAELFAKTGSFLVPVTVITQADGREDVIQGTQYAQIKHALNLT